MRNLEFTGSERADVLVIGGGVIGLTIARALRERGLERVMLVERSRLGAEASSAAGGMLALQAEADSADAFFELAQTSRALYPAWAQSLFEETGIDVELEDTGTLYLAFTDEDEEAMERRFRWQSEAGLLVERLSASEACALEPFVSSRLRGALRFPLDVQVENRRLISALRSSLDRRGVRVMTGTHAQSLTVEQGEVTGVVTPQGLIYAPIVIVASGAWTSSLMATDTRVPPVRIEPVRGQMLCFETAANRLRHVLYSPRGYIVPRRDGRMLAGSTTEHAGFEKNVTLGGIHTIIANALEMAEMIVRDARLVDMWAGLRPRADDDLPVIGACSEIRGLFYATGHYRNGILLAPVTGELIADQVTTGIAPALLEAFSPDRFHSVSVA